MKLHYNNGLEIEGLDLNLDAHRKADFSFVSHAHSDHTAPHKKILATPETALFFKERHKKKFECQTLECFKKTQIGEFEIELLPAGHILGCAQIKLTRNGHSIVYTGDFKLQKGATTPPAEIVKADTVIMESTFGQPQYVFPEREKSIDQLISFVQKCLLSNQTPIVLAYSLGKSQEAVKELGDFGFELYAEQTVYRFCKLYEECGVQFHNLHPLPVEDFRGKVLIFPPYFRKYKSLIRKIYPKRTCFLSGWAMSSDAKFRVGSDLTIPLSDHADYNDLIRYVEESNPKKVYTLHGFPEFAEDLRRRGFDAEYLDKGMTVDLSNSSSSGSGGGSNFDLFLG